MDYRIIVVYWQTRIPLHPGFCLLFPDISLKRVNRLLDLRFESEL